MLRVLFDLLAPHYCCSCGTIGAIICEYCKYDIITHRYTQCVVCLKPIGSTESLCNDCRGATSHAWCGGERTGSLERLIDLYKFERTTAVAKPLVEILDEILPYRLGDVIVVPVPTISRHIRQRGYDHMALLAQQLARKRGLPCRQLLRRRANSVQHEASRSLRRKQAAEAFEVARQLNGETCLLIDDIYTTGSTIEYAARTLLSAGAGEIWAVVLSRQPLEKN